MIAGIIATGVGMLCALATFALIVKLIWKRR